MGVGLRYTGRTVVRPVGVGENEARVIGMNARASSGRFASTLSAEQLEAIAAGLILKESQRSIAARLDLPRTTVRDACKRAAVTDIVRAIRAEQAAEQAAAADALKREKARAADAERRKRERTAARAEQSGQTPERVAQHRAGVGTRPKPELRASALSTPVTSRWAGLPRSETQVDFIRRKQAERELPLMQPTLIVTPTMQRTIWPEGDGYDRQDIEQLAIHLHEDLGCPSADILNALLAAKPGVSYLATARPDFRLVPIEPEQ